MIVSPILIAALIVLLYLLSSVYILKEYGEASSSGSGSSCRSRRDRA